MVKKSMQISAGSGIEARPIALLVQVASKYESKVYLETGDKRVNAKSIMGMMSLELDNGDYLTISVDGSDEESAIAELEDFLKKEMHAV